MSNRLPVELSQSRWLLHTIAAAALTACAALCGPAHSADLPGVSFLHHDWQVVCDNTRTCRAAGYQSDEGGPLPVSVLLTRKAGPRQPVTAQLQIGNYDNDELLKQLPATLKLTMKINGRSLGNVIVSQNDLIADLSPKQVDALVAALGKNSVIEWSTGDTVWTLSSKGATAALLKIDEFQGRIGTVGAMLRKGAKSEEAVLPALPVPVVNAAPIPKQTAGDEKFARTHQKALLAALRASIKDEGCDRLAEVGKEDNELSVTRLSATKLLASALCWRAAYNEGYGYWVINDTAPYAPMLVTTSGSEFGESSISSAQKGRGLGDCWSTEAWTWDGKQFVQTQSSSSGMCKLIAPGGAWTLPLIVTEVRALNATVKSR